MLDREVDGKGGGNSVETLKKCRVHDHVTDSNIYPSCQKKTFANTIILLLYCTVFFFPPYLLNNFE